MRGISSILFCLLLIPAALMAQPMVQIVAVDRMAYENPTLPEWGIESAETPSRKAAFQVSRTGSVARPLTVKYSIGGTALNGSDYTALSGEVTIAAGSRFARIIVHPLDDSEVERYPYGPNPVMNESVIITLQSSPRYVRGILSRAKIRIIDDEPLVLVYVADRVGSVGSVAVIHDIQSYTQTAVVEALGDRFQPTNNYLRLPERQR